MRTPHDNYQYYAIEASPVEPKFKSPEPKEGAVMPLVRIDISKTASRQPEWLGLRCVNVLECR
jgi:hypothetical protein